MPPESQTTTSTEFVKEAFDTSVSDEAVSDLLAVIDRTISNLREQVKDDTLGKMLRAGSGSYLFRGSMTRDGLQPESFTQEAVIEPLLDELGYEYATEAGGLSGGRTMVADYTVSLRDHPDIDSTRLLVEAEPINKDLDSRDHGVGQVKDWLSQREFESDLGFATDGLRWAFVRYDPDSYTHNVIEKIDLQPVFIALFENQTSASPDLLDEAVFEADRVEVAALQQSFAFENFLTIAGEAREVIQRKQQEITDEFYDDYIRYVFGVVEGDDDRSGRSLVGDGVAKPKGADEEQARLFAVELMNRLIFVKFLEDKHIVQPDLLEALVEAYEDGLYPDSLYQSLLQDLFYDVMNTPPDKRSPHVQNIDLFADIPYLNGGLFSPTIEGEEFDEEDFDVANSVLFDIIDLLSQYSFSAEGAPTELDPSVLGNVFEKTVNYITTDNADTNKELGAYYTPSEITRFCAEETVRPALLDRFKQTLMEERDWKERDVRMFDSVYELVESLPPNMAIIGALLEEMDNFRVVDPACGSGHFLTSVLEELVTLRKALYAQSGADQTPGEYRLRKQTVLNNIYGVDVMGPAVEIGKLRLWLSIIGELEREDLEELDEDELALPNIVFNLRQGNSLVGYTGFPETTDNGEFTLERFNEDTVRERYEGIIESIRLHEQGGDEADRHRREAFEQLRQSREDLLDDIHADFVDAGIDGITKEQVADLDPFHWVLEFAEVYADGGFDAIVGNPPWDRIKPLRDDFFSRYDSRFRTYLPERKNARQEELLEDSQVAEAWEEYNRKVKIQADYFNNAEGYELQRPTVAGRTEGTENDLSALFLERVFQIARDDGYVAQVLPGAIFNGSSAKDLRMKMLNEASVKSLVTFENKGIFPEIDNRYNFGVVVFENQGETDDLRGTFLHRDLEVLQRFDEIALSIPKRVLAEYSPEARIFPYVQDQQEAEVLNTLFQHPPVSSSESREWFAKPYRELDRTNDADRFVEDPDKGSYPVLGGSNIFQFIHDDSYFGTEPPEFWSVPENEDPEKSAKRRIREKNYRKLKRAVYDAFDGTGSQKAFVKELLEEHRGKGLCEEDVLLDSTEYRVVFRDVARASDERTIIASVIPSGVVCHNTLHTVRPYQIGPSKSDLSEPTLHGAYERIFDDRELFVALGLINSLPFDFLLRTKVDTHIVMYKFEESQVPRLTEGDDWFEYISTRTARLNCYGEAFAEMRDRLGGIEPATDMDERRRLQAEIDAAAFHAYGLNHEQTEFVLDGFHRVRDPRIMDEAYFEMVLEKYESLSD